MASSNGDQHPVSSPASGPASGGAPVGIRIVAANGDLPALQRDLMQRLQQHGLDTVVSLDRLGPAGSPGNPATDTPPTIACRLRADFAARVAPACDTLSLARLLGLDTSARTADLDREIVAALLVSPIPITFPSIDEFDSAIRIRRNIVTAARKTVLAFDTISAERPEDCWIDDPVQGFLVRPGVPLAEALRRATQPDASGRLFSFSCYRATEYVILLAVVEELALSHPTLLQRLQRLAERRAVKSGEFHEVYLYEYGSVDAPLPSGYYVPGDRVWFRNPDARSADIEGYEGSWVFYHGDGRFSNFWKRDQPYTLDGKCVEIHHWADAVATGGPNGGARIDEAKVERLVAATLLDPVRRDRIIAKMRRFRAPRGVHGQGGCIDSTRESVRWVRPDTCDLQLPADA